MSATLIEHRPADVSQEIEAAPGASPGEVDPAALRSLTEEIAYDRYLQRGCADGSDLDDWLAAEREARARLEMAAR